MRRSRVLRLAMGCACALALAQSVAGAAPKRELRFLTAAEIEPQLLLPAPPTQGSAAARAELAEVARLSRAATASEWRRAKWDNDHEDATMFTPVFGPGFDLRALPATAKLMGEVDNEQQIAKNLAKDYFRRTRPWILDPRLRTCARDQPPQSSYPSGHSSMAFAMAIVLARAAPALGPKLLDRANAYARERIVCGMHFRSDTTAGQTIGTAVAAMMLQNPQVQADVAAASSELRAAHLAP